MSSHLKSKSLNNRIHSLDLLRGFAVLGILIMNITNFSHINIAYMNTTFLNLNETQVMIASTITSSKWITIFVTLNLLIFGLLKNKTTKSN